jgi:predicted TIM-barrel fold metal-dependent hydrolase
VNFTFQVEFLVEATGADHILFGTDAPMRDPRPQLGWVRRRA